MRRFLQLLKYAILALIALLFVMFAIYNNAEVFLNLPFNAITVQMRIFTLVITSCLLGVLVMYIYDLVKNSKYKRKIRHLEDQVQYLKNEVEGLRAEQSIYHDKHQPLLPR